MQTSIFWHDKVLLALTKTATAASLR